MEKSSTALNRLSIIILVLSVIVASRLSLTVVDESRYGTIRPIDYLLKGTLSASYEFTIIAVSVVVATLGVALVYMSKSVQKKVIFLSISIIPLLYSCWVIL